MNILKKIRINAAITSFPNYIGSSCRLYARDNSLACSYNEKDTEIKQKGWRGYCLEWDPKNSSACLLWYPLDRIYSDGLDDGAGINFDPTLAYCARAEGDCAKSSSPDPSKGGPINYSIAYCKNVAKVDPSKYWRTRLIASSNYAVPFKSDQFSIKPGWSNFGAGPGTNTNKVEITNKDIKRGLDGDLYGSMLFQTDSPEKVELRSILPLGVSFLPYYYGYYTDNPKSFLRCYGEPKGMAQVCHTKDQWSTGDCGICVGDKDGKHEYCKAEKFAQKYDSCWARSVKSFKYSGVGNDCYLDPPYLLTDKCTLNFMGDDHYVQAHTNDVTGEACALTYAKNDKVGCVDGIATCAWHTNDFVVGPDQPSATEAIRRLFVESKGYEWKPGAYVFDGANNNWSASAMPQCAYTSVYPDGKRPTYDPATKKCKPVDGITPAGDCFAKTPAQPNDASTNDYCYVKPKISYVRMGKYGVGKDGKIDIAVSGYVDLKFNSKIDPDQLPLTQYVIDWDGPDSGAMDPLRSPSGTNLFDRPNPNSPHTFTSVKLT